jgi:two-component system sensor histidine kinase PilS (NtrC family)
MSLRVLSITVLLGSLLVLQVYQNREPIPALYVLIVTTYLVTIAYSLVFSRLANLTLFSYAQIIGDLLIITGLIYSTGGLDSPFTFLYIMSILAAGFLLYRRGNFIVAALAGIFYGLIIDLQYYGVILDAPYKIYSESELFYHIFLSFFAFLSVAFLSSSLSERLRTVRAALEEKSIGLQELQALNDSIVRSMADGMVTVGMDGLITGLNKSGEEITGLTYRGVLGRSFSEVFGMIGVEEIYEEMSALESRRTKYEIIFDRGGRRLVLGIFFQPLVNDRGEVAGQLGIFQDLTPMKEMEAEIKRKDRLAVIGELAAGMAHEIRNPLASLSGSLQVLKAGEGLNEEDRQLMDIALVEMDRLDNIVTEFLNYAKPRPPQIGLADIGRLLKDTVRLVSNRNDIGGDIVMELDLPDYPVEAVVDPDQIKQVVINLANNAIQSIGDKGTVRLSASYDTSDNVTIEVEDDGDGIEAEHLDKIFYPFYSTKPGGAGLGLAIVFRIIEDHKGRIAVNSVPGVGSKFTISLPKGNGV